MTLQNSIAGEAVPPRAACLPARLRIASRESRLAIWQAEHIRQRLCDKYPGMIIDILGMTTRGDQIIDRPLAAIGGKGLFIKELEVALQEGRADLAVHSMKDLPMDLPDGFVVAAVCAREKACDAFLANHYASLDELPPQAVVGTSSLRREAIVRAAYPRLQVRSLRGNLDTRLRKLDAGEYDAIILAAAGLIRLGLAARIRRELPLEQFLPAPGQGVLAIEIRADRDDLLPLLAPLHDGDAACCVQAERAFSRALGGSCQLPLAAHAIIADGELWLRGMVATPDGRRTAAGEVRAACDDGEAAGSKLAEQLLAGGAGEILDLLASGR